MKSDLAVWLAQAGPWAWQTSVTLLVIVNLAAALALVATRSRTLVDRWTPRWLSANLALLGFGLGTPLLTWVARVGLAALPDLGAAPLIVPK